MENKNIIGLRLHFCKLKYDNSFYTNQCQNLGEYTIIDCTSRCKEFASDLSPFFLGPATGSDGATASTVETLFQCGKVYPCHDNGGTPNKDFFEWRDKMYGKKRGELSKEELRHPQRQLGYEASDCLYFPWYDKETGKYIPLDYVSSRKKVYIPNYARLVSQTDTFKQLKKLVSEGKKIALADFDTYNYYSKSAMEKKYESYVNKCKKDHLVPSATLDDFLSIKSIKDVINCPFMPAGHSFVIKALLQGDLEVTEQGEVIDCGCILE